MRGSSRLGPAASKIRTPHTLAQVRICARREEGRAEVVAQELAKEKLQIEPGKTRSVATRREVQRAWLAVGDAGAAVGARGARQTIFRRDATSADGEGIDGKSDRQSD